ncbi:MAG: GtrA family protein [Actinomycetota bacterium]|nr:GtrA family protein [Actinomycetota bacterium]
MDFIRDGYIRFRVLIHEAAKFGTVGILAFLITIGGANALRSGAGFDELSSVTVATIVSTIFAFVGNKLWAFRHRNGGQLRRESILFFVLNVIGLVVQLTFVGVTRYGLGLKGTFSYNAANILGVAAATVFRLYSYRRWVFLMADGEPLTAEHLQPETSGA